MSERELEQTMKKFYQHEIDVLVCTTIIESGIDIPNANTIIINRADTLGLAQLHQCKGRVGRSHKQAYAYLLTPEHQEQMTGDGKKRLDAILALNHLGAGFNLSSEDLDIRGAGELLGNNQSGHVHAIGINLFTDMLAQAVKTLQQNDHANAEIEKICKMDIKCAALIPSDYIDDTNLRLTLYQRLQSLTTTKSIIAFK